MKHQTKLTFKQTNFKYLTSSARKFVVPKNRMNSTSCRQPHKLSSQQPLWQSVQTSNNRPTGTRVVDMHSRLMQARVQPATHHASDQDAGPHRQPEQQIQRRC